MGIGWGWALVKTFNLRLGSGSCGYADQLGGIKTFNLLVEPSSILSRYDDQIETPPRSSSPIPPSDPLAWARDFRRLSSSAPPPHPGLRSVHVTAPRPCIRAFLGHRRKQARSLPRADRGGLSLTLSSGMGVAVLAGWGVGGMSCLQVLRDGCWRAVEVMKNGRQRPLQMLGISLAPTRSVPARP